MGRNDDNSSLCLVPLRNGRPLSSQNPRAVIGVSNRGHTVVGRLELLSCLYAACGCHRNVFSTRGKCNGCQLVNQWALVSLSRQMLRIKKGNRLSVRGGHSFVVISGAGKSSTVSCVDEGTHISKCPSEWRGEHVISHGTILSMRELDGDGRLDFIVSSVGSSIQCAANRAPQPPGSSQQVQESALLATGNINAVSTGECHDGSTRKAHEGAGIQLYFCALGQDLSRRRLDVLRNEAALKGASVVSDYRYASHIVISKQVESIEVAAEYFGVSREDFEKHLDENAVQCVLPRYLSKSSSSILLARAHFSNLWPGHIPKRNNNGDKPNPKKRKMTPNTEISEVFVRLSKLYQGAPLLPEDIWKAYRFHKLAGRLLHLNFDVVRTESSKVGSLLKKIPGFSASAIGMIQEFIRHGKIARIQNLQNDPIRIAMGNMMSIWGVGRATALDLVQAGYKTIEDVRDGISKGKLQFTRNQLVGVACYEDLLEKMDRGEVTRIGSIVAEAVQSLGFTSAEATIMGSYRRGKTASGDVDVLITFNDHFHSVPESALREVVDLLWYQGHIAHHLTRLHGMQTGGRSHNEGTGDGTLTAPMSKPNNRARGAMSSGGSYMGVFLSPMKPGKRRRVDIKIYPLKQKPFACLYFTGSAQFNRSMRLFAKERFGLRLSDKGLFDSSGKAVMNGAATEEEIFERLNLVYKDPPSRGFFDDVVPL